MRIGQFFKRQTSFVAFAPPCSRPSRFPVARQNIPSVPKRVAEQYPHALEIEGGSISCDLWPIPYGSQAKKNVPGALL